LQVIHLIHNSQHFRDRYSGHYPPPPHDKNLKSGKNFREYGGKGKKREKKGKREETKRGEGNRRREETLIHLFSCTV